MDRSRYRKYQHCRDRTRHSRSLPAAVLLLLVCTPPVSTAQSSLQPPLQIYEQGNAAFRSGNYPAALSSYLAARRAGLEKNTLTYNIGVTYYKLARYEEARETFRDLLDDAEMAPLAYYNLGLVSLKLGDAQSARRWFHLTIRESDSAKLRTAAEAMVARLDERKPAARPSRWSGFVTLGGGYDSNVTLRSDSETIVTSEQTDYFGEFFAYGQARISGNRNRGISLEGSLYLLNYEQLNAYNTSSLRLGGSLARRLNHWRVSGSLHYVHTLLDQDGYTRSAALGLRARRRLDRDLHLRLRYEIAYIEDLDTRIAYLQGWRHKSNASAVWRLDDKKRLILSYQLELNDREDLDGTRFVSYSPTRHTLRVRGRYKFSPRYTAALDLRYRYSRYNDPTELASGGTETREENRTRATLSFSHNLRHGMVVSAEYRYTANASNFRRYDYHREEIMLNLLWPW